MGTLLEELQRRETATSEADASARSKAWNAYRGILRRTIEGKEKPGDADALQECMTALELTRERVAADIVVMREALEFASLAALYDEREAARQAAAQTAVDMPFRHREELLAAQAAATLATSAASESIDRRGRLEQLRMRHPDLLGDV